MHHITEHEHSTATTTTTTTITAATEISLLHRTSHSSGSYIRHHRQQRVHMHHITRQLQKEQQMQQQKHQYRETPYRRDSHMEHYMSDILAAPAPAAIAEEPLETKGLCDLSMEDLTHRLEEIKHLQGALSAQSNSRGDRRSSSEATSRHHRHHRHHHHQHQQHHHHQHLSEPAPMVSGTPIFPASRSRSPSPQPASAYQTDSRHNHHSRHSHSSSRAHSPQPHVSSSSSSAYYAQNSYSRPHSRSASPQPLAYPTSAPIVFSTSSGCQFPSRPHSRPHSRSPSPRPAPSSSSKSSSTAYRHSNSSISSIHTTASLPRAPHEALLQDLLDRIDQQHADRDQERIRELEIENEMLRRHHQYRINPDLLAQHADHGHALAQNHGNANLRHS